MRKKQTKYIATLLGLVMLSGFVAPTYTLADSNASDYEVSFLAQVSDVGLLPTSPAYFLKEWGRGIRLFFILDDEKELKYRLEIVDEKAAELAKLEESGVDERGIDRGLENYKDSVEKLKTGIAEYEPDADSQEEVESLREEFEGRLLLHQAVLRELSSKYESALGEIDDLQDELKEVLEENQRLENRLKTLSEEDSSKSKEDFRGGQEISCPSGEYLDVDSDGRERCFLLGKDSPEISYFNVHQISPGNEHDYEFSWSSNNADYCKISDKENGYFSDRRRATRGSEERDLSGLRLGTFHLYCYNSEGEYAQDYVTVEVDEILPEIDYFQATQSNPGDERTYKFSWSSDNADYCKIIDKMNSYFSGRERSSKGSVEKVLTNLNLGTFHLYCYNSEGDYAHDSIEIEIDDPEPEISYFKAYYVGSSSSNTYSFSWESENTSYCEILVRGHGVLGDGQYPSSGKETLSGKGISDSSAFDLYCYSKSGEEVKETAYLKG